MTSKEFIDYYSSLEYIVSQYCKFDGGYYTYYNYNYIPNKNPVIIVSREYVKNKKFTCEYFPFKLSDNTFILL